MKEKGLVGYTAIAHGEGARLTMISGTVQQRSAQSYDVSDTKILQSQALSGRIDAYAATALGNGIVADWIGSALITAVAHTAQNCPPVGAFSFSKHDNGFWEAVDEQLKSYLGSSDHRQIMAKYGFTPDEIDPALRVE